MLTRYEEQLLGRNLDHWTTGGNPYTQLPGGRLPPMPLRKVRVIRAGWYGPGGKPVEVDQVLTLPADDAQLAISLGRAEKV